MRPFFIALAVAGVSCAQPRIIHTISVQETDAKLLYSQKNTLRTGLIQCDVAEDGAFTTCRDVPITFEKKNGTGAKP